MIAASEPLEFIPRGRQAVEEHPGPLVSKHQNSVSSELLLLHRLQNVNISNDVQPTSSTVGTEHWIINGIFKTQDEDQNTHSTDSRTDSPIFLSEFSVNTEEELYFKGHTAVWTRGMAAPDGVLPRTCFTTDTPIRHAFFCPSHFIRTTEPDKRKSQAELDFKARQDTNLAGICIIDSKTLRVYLNTGEDYLTSLEFSVSNVWHTKFGILLEKNASNATIESHSISMPRLFSLSHPLDEMCPVLIKGINGSVGYFTESDYKIIFAYAENDLVLLYDKKIGKHFVSRLRTATVDETSVVCANDTLNSEFTNSIHGMQSDLMKSASLKFNVGSSKPNTSHTGAKTSFGASTRTHSPFLHVTSPQNFLQNSVSSPITPIPNSPSHRSFMNSPLDRLQNTMCGQSFSIQNIRKVGHAQPSKAIVPELCLEHIWTESINTKDYLEVASRGFMHTDLIGQTYICYLLTRTSKLQLVRLEKATSSQRQIFGIAVSIPAKDAIGLDEMKMIAVIAPCGTLLLYTGPSIIGKVHVGGVLSGLANLGPSFGASYPRRSSLLPASNSDARFEEDLHTLSPVHPLQSHFPAITGHCCGLRDAVGNRLTLTYPSGKMYRISIPLMSECPFVTKCLNALRQVLKKDIAISLMAKWFGVRNAPGSRDLNPNQEWHMFKTVVLEMLGRPLATLSQNSRMSGMSGGTASADEPKKRRKSENCEGSTADWKYLLAVVSPKRDFITKDKEMAYVAPRINGNTPLFPYTPLVFYTLHLLYENMKVEAMMKLHLPSLAELLHELATDLKLENYCQHYFLDYPQLAYNITSSCILEADIKRLQNMNYLSGPVPNIFKHIFEIVNAQKPFRYPYIENVNSLSKKIVQLTNFIFTGTNDSDCIETIIPLPSAGSRPSLPADCKIFEMKEDFTQSHQDTYKHSILNAFLELNVTRKDIEKLPVALHYLFAEVLESSRLNPPIDKGSRIYELLLRPDLLAHATFDEDRESYECNKTYRNVQKEHSLSPRIPATPDVIPKSDVVLGEDGMEHMDTKLLLLRFPDDLRICEVRHLLASSRPVPIDIVQSLGVSDHDFIEEQEKQLFAICTRTMALPMGRGMYTMRTCTPASTESLTIPKLCLTGKETVKGATIELQQIEVPQNMSMWPLFHNGVAAGLQITPEAKDIDSTWIVYNKPKVLLEGSSEHGGFLMALGLNGHLKTLSFMSIYEYLVKCEEMTSVGLLLGISAAHRGTMDTTTTKLLSVHIEALLPATALELDIPQNIQVAAIMGIGMIYQETAKRHMAEILLQEIGRPPGPEMENCVERESYALTAGLALGLVTLAQGESPTGLRDLQLPDTLHYYMIGGNKRPLTGSQKEKYKLLPSFQVREGETVNIDVTAPGATLALGLMFFKTGNQAVANWMKPPETNYLLDLVRPDLLLLRILARGLILWDDIRPTRKWLYDQFPTALAFDLKRGPKDPNNDIDHEANSQAYCNIITGAAMCLGLRYAGTEDPEAFDNLKHILDLFLNMSGQYIGEYAGKATVESCMVLVLISLSLVYAGTGNIKVLRICRMLRNRLGSSNSHVTYGSHMAIHMSLGFLFLGAGRYTLSRSPQAIAALVCALFPKFPTHSNDNRYHLQAFRHLYVLAVEPRIFLPRDIDSGKLSLCNLSYIKLNSEELINAPMAPCILPELDSLKAVIVNDPNYWPVSFEKGKNWDQLERVLAKCGCIDIKQKAGCMSHLDDPDRLKSLLAETLTTEQYSCWKIEPKSLVSFSNDPKVQNFTNTFLRKQTLDDNDSIPASTEELEIQQIITLQFYNCLTKDRMHALPIYMNLLMALRKFRSTPNTFDVWQFKLIATILRNRKRNILLSTENLRSLTQRVTTQMERWGAEFSVPLRQYIFAPNCSFLQNMQLSTLHHLAVLITFFDLPVNIMNCVDVNVSEQQPNILHLLVAFKNLNLSSVTVQCICNILETQQQQEKNAGFR